ncbi:MAG: serpin family protein, partial [Bacteroidota bacterium]|nr:serpin family protein [Bacteroidota bacterium]
KIVDVLDMDLLIVNTLYFKGQWHTKFEKDLTTDRDFYLSDSSKIQVPTMELEDTIRFATAEKYIIVELPYSQGNFVMDLILPQNDNTTDSILDILPTLNSMTKELTIAQITIHLPKFEFYYSNNQLAGIIDNKMPLAFTDLADFSKMVTPGVFIDKVIQKTYIKTDEEGTEAVAATGFSFLPTSAIPTEINFDRPFIFIIREVSTNTVMFVGKVADPSKQ